MKRRQFLQFSSLLSAGAIVSVGSQGWVAKSLAQTNPQKRLIVVFLRGGIDGLNVVVPYRESAYYEARPAIAIPAPGEEGGALNLDDRFGLHPALKDLMPYWKNRSLAFIHACGLPTANRSHFNAQNYMESGTPNVETTPDGWLNRLLANIPKGTPVQAVNLGGTTPRILAGQMSVANLATGRNAARSLPVDRPQINTFFDRLYNGNDAISKAYREGREARELLQGDLESEMMRANRGAPSPRGAAGDMQRLARLMIGNSQAQLAFTALGGWDTHANQGNSRGSLANNLKPLGESLATLVRELGPVYQETVIVVMSEFGRTVKENGNRGTDHGYGNVMLVLGGGIRGGKMYGEWPGLERSQLYDGRDLAVTTDFRDAIASVLQQHLQLQKQQISQVFPNHRLTRSLTLL